VLVQRDGPQRTTTNFLEVNSGPCLRRLNVTLHPSSPSSYFLLCFIDRSLPECPRLPFPPVFFPVNLKTVPRFPFPPSPRVRALPGHSFSPRVLGSPNSCRPTPRTVPVWACCFAPAAPPQPAQSPGNRNFVFVSLYRIFPKIP